MGLFFLSYCVNKGFSVENNSVRTFRTNVVFLSGTWNQYDAAIFPAPTFAESIRNFVPLISKAMDRVHSRELATLAMLPRWEGFCTGSQEGVQMTAWEAMEQIQNVAYCMTNSECIEGNYITSDVPSAYNFGKVHTVSFGSKALHLLLFFHQ